MTSGENAVNSPQREQTVPAGTVGISNSFEPMSAQSGVPLISVVVPVYKEEKSIRPFLARMEKVLSGIGSYEIIFCLDPCPDETKHVIREEIARNDRIGLLVFSRRFGQPAATMAGIHISRWRTGVGDPCRSPYCQLAPASKEGDDVGHRAALEVYMKLSRAGHAVHQHGRPAPHNS